MPELWWQTYLNGTSSPDLQHSHVKQNFRHIRAECLDTIILLKIHHTQFHTRVRALQCVSWLFDMRRCSVCSIDDTKLYRLLRFCKISFDRIWSVLSHQALNRYDNCRLNHWIWAALMHPLSITSVRNDVFFTQKFHANRNGSVRGFLFVGPPRW